MTTRGDDVRTQRLAEFVQWVADHIEGDEKGEAQLYLDQFFRAFGHEGAIEAGATYEEGIHKDSKKGKTGFADLVWKPRVLIEMKKRGADLSQHYSQAFDYWQGAVPNRPRYVMLCNFDEFWVFDFDTQIDTPIDTCPDVKAQSYPSLITIGCNYRLSTRVGIAALIAESIS